MNQITLRRGQARISKGSAPVVLAPRLWILCGTSVRLASFTAGDDSHGRGVEPALSGCVSCLAAPCERVCLSYLSVLSALWSVDCPSLVPLSLSLPPRPGIFSCGYACNSDAEFGIWSTVIIEFLSLYIHSFFAHMTRNQPLLVLLFSIISNTWSYDICCLHATSNSWSLC